MQANPKTSLKKSATFFSKTNPISHGLSQGISTSIYNEAFWQKYRRSI